MTVSFAALSDDGHLDLSVHVDADAWPDLDVPLRRMGFAWLDLLVGTDVPAAESLMALSA